MKKRILLFATLLVAFTSCSENDDNTVSIEEIPLGTNLRVNYFTSICEGLFTQECLLVQEGDRLGSGDWNFFYSEIEGFEFDPGFVYNLEVNKTTIDNPPADGSSLKYELIRVISKVAVTCSFDNAVEDLDWLRFEINQRELNPTEDMKYCYIAQAEIQNEPVFLYWDCNPIINKVILVYDCVGSIIGYLGNDNIKFEDLENMKIIWQPDNFVCQPIF